MRIKDKGKIITIYLFFGEFALLCLFSLILMINAPETTQNSQKSKEGYSYSKKFHLNGTKSSFSSAIRNQIIKSAQKYIDNCIKYDGLRPISQECSKLSGISMSAVDMIDTLYIAQASEQYQTIRQYIGDSFTCNVDHYVPTHDLITHVIGGFISAYSLTNDILFLEKAKECSYVAKAAFKNPFPHPLVHGQKLIAKDYNWINGTTLTDSSGFLIEFRAIYHLTDDKSFLKLISKYYDCVIKHMENTRTIPTYWSTKVCAPLSVDNGLTSHTVGFFANTFRDMIFNSTEQNQNAAKVLSDLFERKRLKDIASQTNTTKSRFYSSFCELVPLMHVLGYNPHSSIFREIKDKCFRLSESSLPSQSGILEEAYIDVDDTSFDFDSSLLEFSLLKSGNLKDISYLRHLNYTLCGDGLCQLSTQDTPQKVDFMPPIAFSKWLKLLYMDGIHLDYGSYVLNEAGHIIPKFSST